MGRDTLQRERKLIITLMRTLERIIPDQEVTLLTEIFFNFCDQIERGKNVLIITGFRGNTRSFGWNPMAKGNGRIRATV